MNLSQQINATFSQVIFWLVAVDLLFFHQDLQLMT